MLFDIVNVQNWTALVLPSRFGDAQRSGRPLSIFAGWLSPQSGRLVRADPVFDAPNRLILFLIGHLKHYGDAAAL
jgi:hypothetical protein